jgi:hypothetical protein
MLGVPASAVSLGKAAIDGNPTLALNSLVGLASPQLGLLNGIASLFGLPSIGEVVGTGLGFGPYGSVSWTGERSGGGWGGYAGDRGPGGSSGDTSAASQGASAFGPGLGNGNDGRGGGSYGGGSRGAFGGGSGSFGEGQY